MLVKHWVAMQSINGNTLMIMIKVISESGLYMGLVEKYGVIALPRDILHTYVKSLQDRGLCFATAAFLPLLMYLVYSRHFKLVPQGHGQRHPQCIPIWLAWQLYVLNLALGIKDNCFMQNSMSLTDFFSQRAY